METTTPEKNNNPRCRRKKSPIGWELRLYRMRRYVSLARLAKCSGMSKEDIVAIEKRRLIPTSTWLMLRQTIGKLSLDKDP